MGITYETTVRPISPRVSPPLTLHFSLLPLPQNGYSEFASTISAGANNVPRQMGDVQWGPGGWTDRQGESGGSRGASPSTDSYSSITVPVPSNYNVTELLSKVLILYQSVFYQNIFKFFDDSDIDFLTLFRIFLCFFIPLKDLNISILPFHYIFLIVFIVE